MHHDCYTYHEIVNAINCHAKTIIMKETIASNLKFLRKKHGWKMRQVAAMIPLSLGAYQKYEEKLAEPSIATLKTLADIYGVTIEEIISKEGKTV